MRAMATDMHDPAERRRLLAELVAGGAGAPQAALVQALAARGVEVTQAPLSRDLRELGAVKGPGGYRVPGAAGDPLGAALAQWLSSATPAQHLVVLKTPPGGASPLAVVLDAHTPAPVIGTVAGDATLLVVTATSAAAKKLCADFERRAAAAGTGGASVRPTAGRAS